MPVGLGALICYKQFLSLLDVSDCPVRERERERERERARARESERARERERESNACVTSQERAGGGQLGMKVGMNEVQQMSTWCRCFDF